MPLRAPETDPRAVLKIAKLPQEVARGPPGEAGDRSDAFQFCPILGYVGCKRLDTSTQGEYTKSNPALENVNDFNVSKRQPQILPLRPTFLTTEAVTGNDMGCIEPIHLERRTS